jgi:hypothetical protein
MTAAWDVWDVWGEVQSSEQNIALHEHPFRAFDLMAKNTPACELSPPIKAPSSGGLFAIARIEKMGSDDVHVCVLTNMPRRCPSDAAPATCLSPTLI